MSSNAIALDAEAFVRGLPKAEIHLHLQGAASVATILELSQRHPDLGVPTQEAALREFYTFTDFARFVEVYMAVNELVQTADDVRALVVGLSRDLKAANVRYAEVTVTPDAHLMNGIAPADVTKALEDGRVEAAESGVELAWVFDIAGQLGVESGVRTVTWAERHLPAGSVGFGLGGPEIGVPRPQFVDVFRRAQAIGLASVPHAGETTGPQTIRDSIEVLEAVRIGHGISAAQDPALMAELVERDIVLEVCPTSNVCTRAVTHISEHPLPILRAAGVRTTINTDDHGMFNTDLVNEYLVAHEHLGLSLADLVETDREAVRASFAGDDTKTRLLAEIDAYAASASVVQPLE